MPLPPDAAFIVIKGRRWRASDPHIPPRLRQELVNELMAARRGVAGAGTPLEVREFRTRVNDAKVALGERGRGWWLAADPEASARRVDAAIRTLLRSRAPGRTICPSDAARVAGGETWRSLLPLVRARATLMAEHGEIDILRRGEPVRDVATAGVLRYRLGGHVSR